MSLMMHFFVLLLCTGLQSHKTDSTVSHMGYIIIYLVEEMWEWGDQNHTMRSMKGVVENAARDTVKDGHAQQTTFH